MKIRIKFTLTVFIFLQLCILCNHAWSAEDHSQLPDSLKKLLAKYIRFNRNEMAAVQRGNVVAKALETNFKKELAFFGIVRVNAPGSRLIQNFKDIENFKKGKEVLKV